MLKVVDTNRTKFLYFINKETGNLKRLGAFNVATIKEGKVG